MRVSKGQKQQLVECRTSPSEDAACTLCELHIVLFANVLDCREQRLTAADRLIGEHA